MDGQINKSIERWMAGLLAVGLADQPADRGRESEREIKIKKNGRIGRQRSIKVGSWEGSNEGGKK